MDKAKARIAELESTETVTSRRYDYRFEEVEKSYAEEMGALKEISARNTDGLINNVKVAKTESIKSSVERNFTLTRFEKHICVLQALIYANIDRKVTLKKAMETVRELLECRRCIDRLEWSVKILILAEKVQRLTDLVESEDLKLQTVSGPVKEASCLR